MMTLRWIALACTTALCACSGGGGDADEGVILITHTGPGTLYWE